MSPSLQLPSRMQVRCRVVMFIVSLTVAAVNDFQVRTTEIQNAYIQAPVAEKILTVLGTEFGPDAGKSAVVVRALYGNKSAGDSFWDHLADFMKHMEYISCPEDPYLWMKPIVRPSDGADYYAYILLYVDDILCIHYDPESVLAKVDKYFKLRPDTFREPDMYWGSKVRPMKLENVVWAVTVCSGELLECSEVREVESRRKMKVTKAGA